MRPLQVDNCRSGCWPPVPPPPKPSREGTWLLEAPAAAGGGGTKAHKGQPEWPAGKWAAVPPPVSGVCQRWAPTRAFVYTHRHGGPNGGRVDDPVGVCIWRPPCRLLRVGLQAGGPYGLALASVAVDSTPCRPRREHGRLNRATVGWPNKKKNDMLCLISYIISYIQYHIYIYIYFFFYIHITRF